MAGNPQTVYQLERFQEYITGEQRAMMSEYADPVTLHFKVMINWTKSYGLFAEETYTNSALAYLKRIGEDMRYEMLKHWIKSFQSLIRDFDFLMLEIEGLDAVQTHKPWDIFTNEDKINIVVRETSDLFIQFLLTTYKKIWYDETRGVEVLPINLRRFDVNVLVFASGYFDLLQYDDEFFPDDIERLVFPTLRKLDNKFFTINETGATKFNSVLYQMTDCLLDNEESGKSFASSVVNEQNSSYIKSSIAFTYKFAQYSGTWNNISGNFNYGNLLAMAAVQEAAEKVTESPTWKELMKDAIKGALNSAKDAAIDTVKNLARERVRQLKNKLRDTFTKVTSLWGNLDVNQLITNTITTGIDQLQANVFDNPLTTITNNLSLNFGNDLFDLYNNNFSDRPSNITLQENNAFPTSNPNNSDYNLPTNNPDVGIRLGQTNIYTGESW